MKLTPLIFGSTGMIGKSILLECLDTPSVESVLVINRHPCGITHKKLEEIILIDISDLTPVLNELSGYNTCFFCIGVTSAGLSENEYSKMTYDLTVKIAATLLKINKDMVFCYISGAGSDRTEKGRIMWARVKGRTENALLAMPFKKAYMFRPGYIQPMKGIKSKTALYNFLYTFSKPFYFLLKPFKSMVTDSVSLGKAMIRAASEGYDKNIIESSDINKLADR